MASNQSLCTSEVEKAKAVIKSLSSTLSPEQLEQEHPSTSAQALASSGPTNGQQPKPSNARPPVNPDFETTRLKGEPVGPLWYNV